MTRQTVDQITNQVKEFYEKNPYPGLGDKLMFKNAQRLLPYFKRPGKACFPGCGTGHGVVALGVLRPDLELYGLDLSAPSLNIAKRLAEKYHVAVNLAQGVVTP